MVNMIIDGKNVSAPKDTMLLEAIRGAGISVPTLCAHESVSRSGACRLCVVEIKKGNRTRIVSRHRREHEAEPRLRLSLQLVGCAAGSGHSIPTDRMAVVATDCRAGDEPEFGLGNRQCLASQKRQTQ